MNSGWARDGRRKAHYYQPRFVGPSRDLRLFVRALCAWKAAPGLAELETDVPEELKCKRCKRMLAEIRGRLLP